MKNVKCSLWLTFLVIPYWILGQIPPSYYDNADGLGGASLKNSLHNIIDDHVKYPYSGSGTDVWDILKLSDSDPNDANNVILIYSGTSVDAAQEYNNGNGWNREHVWAKSRGNFGTSSGTGTDIHNLVPADISVNSARNNRWFDKCAIPYYDNGVETGSYTCGSSLWAWEPRDEVKGDIARMLFYMDTRYEGDNSELDLTLIDSFPSNNSTQSPIHARLSTLIQWHQNDPVDDFERNRNNVIYSFQNNRNPFVDHPDYVCQVWITECQILPLDLVSFNLDYKEKRNHVELFWRTENQVNSSHFEIEHSLDARLWETIAEEQARPGGGKFQYQFTDENPIAGNNYYRLKMVDLNGQYEYSPIRVAKSTKEEIPTELVIYPNPASDNCQLVFKAHKAEDTKILVYDNLRKLVLERSVLSNVGETHILLPINTLPAGMYTVHVNNKSNQLVSRLIKQ